MIKQHQKRVFSYSQYCTITKEKQIKNDVKIVKQK